MGYHQRRSNFQQFKSYGRSRIELAAFHMQSERSTAELHPSLLHIAPNYKFIFYRTRPICVQVNQ